MISAQEIRDLLRDPPADKPIVSLYLDLSVNSDNKRTHGIFLNKLRHRYEHPLLKEYGGHPVLEAVLDRAERWLDSEYEEANRGAALFIELGSNDVHALQLPEPVQSAIHIGRRPAIRPLAELLERENRHTVVLVDREHLRLLEVVFGRITREQELAPAAHPAAHDVQAGGYSQRDHQQRKAEEARQFLKEFAAELEGFVERRPPEGIVLLGTDENVSHFRDQIPQTLRDKVVHCAHARVDASGAEILERLEDCFEQELAERRQNTVALLHDRIDNQHFAAGGFDDTLDQLQRGKVEVIVIDRALQRQGSQCTQCGVRLDRAPGSCPYCGGETRDGVDLVEAMVRSAIEQDAEVHFVPSVTVAQYEGVGALLRF